MNPFSLKNLKQYGMPLLISFLGFFIGYTQKTNAKLEGIYEEQTKITYRIDSYADIMSRIELKVDELTKVVDKHTDDIEQLKVRINVLEHSK